MYRINHDENPRERKREKGDGGEGTSEEIKEKLVYPSGKTKFVIHLDMSAREA